MHKLQTPNFGPAEILAAMHYATPITQKDLENGFAGSTVGSLLIPVNNWLVVISSLDFSVQTWHSQTGVPFNLVNGVWV